MLHLVIAEMLFCAAVLKGRTVYIFYRVWRALQAYEVQAFGRIIYPWPFWQFWHAASGVLVLLIGAILCFFNYPGLIAYAVMLTSEAVAGAYMYIRPGHNNEQFRKQNLEDIALNILLGGILLYMAFRFS